MDILRARRKIGSRGLSSPWHGPGRAALVAFASAALLCAQGAPGQLGHAAWRVGGVASERAEPFLAEVAWLRGADLLELRDGRKIRLQGLSLPTPPLRPKDFVSNLQAFLKNRCEQKTLWIAPEARVERGDPADFCAVVRERPDAPSINEEALELGLALYDARTSEVAEAPALVAAAQRAQARKAGWYALSADPRFDRRGPIPFLNGAVLGLYDRDAGRDYKRHIDELAEAGFQHVEFLFSTMLDHVRGSRIDRFHRRTVSDARLVEAIRYSKQKGMSVLLLPIVLLDEQKPEDWRGVIKPDDEEAFWQSYDAMLCHYLDIAEHLGVEMFSMGSELGSLEDRTSTWRRLVQNARGRYRGVLTYSANWDHYDVSRWFDALDIVGMTAYFSLTKKKDPSLEELEEGWRTIGAELQRKLTGFPKPVFFTELGYASQDGINTDPWNYLMAQDRIDLKEQALCFEAFLRVEPSLRFLQGAYFFDYFEEGGPTDHTYAPRGKPAMEQWRRWAQRK